jgi:hypothetical protein
MDEVQKNSNIERNAQSLEPFGVIFSLCSQTENCGYVKSNNVVGKTGHGRKGTDT